VSFAAPAWLGVGLLVVAAGVLATRAADRRRRRDLEEFATRDLLPDLTATLSTSRRRTKRALVLAATALAFVALAGPELGFDWEETQRRGIDVLIAVDVSRSMLARDVQPDRLRRAKLAVDDLVHRLGGDRVGLIAFAGTAFLQCPLTLDHRAFQRTLEALDPDMIPAPGSDLASAIDAARKALASEARNVKLLILLSDGEDLRGGAIAAAQRAAGEDIRIFTVGVGTAAGELIPLPDDESPGTFAKDESGHIVKSRLDEATLGRVAEITDGFYVPLGPRAEGIVEIVERALAPIPREELASRLRRVPRNRYPWPLALAVLLLFVEPFVAERSPRRRAASRLSRVRSGTAVALVLALAPAARTHAASPESAAALYAREDYERAAEEYRELAEQGADPRLDLNLGAAAYRAAAYEEAATAFARALRTEEDAVEEEAFYDLGNAQYRIGEQTLETNPQETIAAWKQAVAAYEEALGLDEGDEDARFNRDFVQRRLDELEKQQNQQRSDDPSDENDEKDEKDEQQDRRQNEQRGDDRSTKNEQPPPQEQPPEPDRDQAGQDPADSNDPGSPPDESPDRPPPPGPGEEEGKNESPRAGRSDHPTPPEAGEDPQPPAGGGPEEDRGELSPAEARDLLDSLRGDEEFMPMARPLPPESQAPRNW